MRNLRNFWRHLRKNKPETAPKPSRFRTKEEQLEIDQAKVEEFDIDFERRRVI